MTITQLKAAVVKGAARSFAFTECLTKREKFMFANPNMDFADMATQLNTCISAIERTYDRLEAKRRIYDAAADYGQTAQVKACGCQSGCSCATGFDNHSE